MCFNVLRTSWGLGWERQNTADRKEGTCIWSDVFLLIRMRFKGQRSKSLTLRLTTMFKDFSWPVDNNKPQAWAAVSDTGPGRSVVTDLHRVSMLCPRTDLLWDQHGAVSRLYLYCGLTPEQQMYEAIVLQETVALCAWGRNALFGCLCFKERSTKRKEGNKDRE